MSLLATFYDPAGGYGACGQPIPNSAFAVALSSDQYQGGAHCGRQVVATCEHPLPFIQPSYSRTNEMIFLDQGKSVQATVMDLCPGCHANSLDLTRVAFSQIANTDLGRINIQWRYL